MLEKYNAKAMTGITWNEYNHNPNSVIVLCVGSVEQHGPHLPLSVDLLIPYNLSLRLSERKDVLVAPPLYYGYRSQPATGGGESFPGTTSISGKTLTYLVKDILMDFKRQGRQKFIVMNGHFENTPFIAEAAYLFTKENPEAKIVIINWWDMIDDTTLDEIFPEGFPGWEVEHASMVETSLIMYFNPELVHGDRIPDQKGEKHKPRPLIFPEPVNLVPESGILYTAKGAKPTIGEAISNELLDKLEEIISAEF